MSSRRSLSGGARNVLRESSSRHNSLAGGRRQSFGGGGANEETTPQKTRRGLLDTAGFRDGALSSASRAASAPRRQSLGGDASTSETPTRDRRAMLAAWRQARTGNPGEETETKKRIRNDPPLPPSSSYTPSSRKLPRTQHAYSQESEDHVSLSQNSTGSHSVNCYDDGSENNSRGARIQLSSGTPLSRRGKLGSARRHTLLGRNVLQNTEGKTFD
jgi:hypothetical protein